MVSERQQRPPPRERTFAEVFPWRSIRRALLLLLLIVAIVMIKRSTGPLLSRAAEMWGAPATPSGRSFPPRAPTRAGFQAGDGAGEDQRAGVRVRLGPGLAPSPPPGDTLQR